MFRGDHRRLGRTAWMIPRTQPLPKWRASLDGPIFGTPAVGVDGDLIVGTLTGNLYAFDLETGKMLWRRRLAGRLFSSPALHHDLIFVGSDADEVVAVRRKDGTIAWKYSLGPCKKVRGRGPESVRCDADSSVAITPDGNLLFGGDAVYSLTPEGKLRWRQDLPGHAFSSAAVGVDGTVFIGAQGARNQRDGNAIFAFNADGTKRWQYRAYWHCDATPAVTTAAVYVGCDDRYIYSLAPADGRLKWRVLTGGIVRSSIAVDRTGNLLVGSFDGKLYAIDPLGKVRWAFRTGAPIQSSPAVDRSGAVVFGSRDKHVYALDAGGKEMWKLRIGSEIDSSVVVGPNNNIIVGDDSGTLHLFK